MKYFAIHYKIRLIFLNNQSLRVFLNNQEKENNEEFLKSWEAWKALWWSKWQNSNSKNSLPPLGQKRQNEKMWLLKPTSWDYLLCTETAARAAQRELWSCWSGSHLWQRKRGTHTLAPPFLQYCISSSQVEASGPGKLRKVVRMA